MEMFIIALPAGVRGHMDGILLRARAGGKGKKS